MAIDSINQLSKEQLLAMSMIGNGQLTNDDSSSTSSTSNESNFAFQALMENLLESEKNSKKINDSLKAINKSSEVNTTETDSKNSSDANGKTANNEALALINKKNLAQNCPTGTRLQDIPMVLTNNHFNFSNNLESVSSNISGGNQNIYDAVNSAAKKYGVDPKLILAIIKQESNFDPNAKSGVGATGLMQIMPDNFSHLGITNGYDINQNINGGTKLLKECLDQFGGNKEMALMAYNAGAGTMQRRGVSSVDDLYKMPKETQNYVPKVMGYYRNGV